jgi:hypothetical protein
VLPPVFALLPEALRLIPRLVMRLPLRASAIAAILLLALSGLYHDWTRLRLGEVFLIEKQAGLVGRMVDRQSGSIATLAPDLVADSGHPIDPRFGTGPFVFRSEQFLPPSKARALGVATQQTVMPMLDKDPPAAILTGYEGAHRQARSPDLDKPLRDWAEHHRWIGRQIGDGLGVIYTRR